MQQDTMDIIDLHCDTITECYMHKLDIKNDKLNVSIDRLKPKSRWAQCFAVYISRQAYRSGGFEVLY